MLIRLWPASFLEAERKELREKIARIGRDKVPDPGKWPRLSRAFERSDAETALYYNGRISAIDRELSRRAFLKQRNS